MADVSLAEGEQNAQNEIAAALGAASKLSESDKKVRKLNKVLREIDALQTKVDSGEVIPDDKQLAKLARRQAVVEEIATLEAR